jgi:hypothetical protein
MYRNKSPICQNLERNKAWRIGADESGAQIDMKAFLVHAALPLVIATMVATMMVATTTVPANAKGCIKGAVVGGVAGHVAGHHAVLGAVTGCLVGHHLAKKHEHEMQNPAGGQQPAPAGQQQ